MLASSRCIQPNSLTTLLYPHRKVWSDNIAPWAFWRKLCALLQPTKKFTTNCFEVMAKLHLRALRHHRYTPSPVPPRGQSCCLTHSTTSHSLRAVINAVVICAICCVQAIHRHRQPSSHTHTALMADFQRKTVASCLHILFVNIALFLKKPGKPTGSKDAS